MLARKVVDKGLVSTCAGEEAISVSSWQGDPTFLSGTVGLMMESGRVVLSRDEWAEVARKEEEEEGEEGEEGEKQGDDENDEAAAFLSTAPSSSTAELSIDRLLEAWRLGEKGGAANAATTAGARLPFPSPQKNKRAAKLLLALPSRGIEELPRAKDLARMHREGQGRAERWLELWAGGRNAPATTSASCSSFPPKRCPSPSTPSADPASEKQKKKSPSPRLPSLSALAAVDVFEVSSPGSAPPEAACPLAVADVLSRGRAASRARAAAREASDRERATSERHGAARAVFDRAAAVAAALGDEQASVELAARAWEHRALAREARARANESAFAGVNGGHVNRFRLDLHGMHVPEALSVLRLHCTTLARLAHPSGVLLQVVTGWGRNSSSGVPRVRPAVLEWLASNSYQFREDVNNAGVVYILLGGAAEGEWGNE